MYDKNPPENGGFVSNLKAYRIICGMLFAFFPKILIRLALFFQLCFANKFFVDIYKDMC